MLPVSSFLIVVTVWVLWRTLARAERLLVTNRSTGWRALLAIGGLLYALPAAVRGHRLAILAVLLGIDAAVTLLSALPLLPARWRRPRRRVPGVVGGAQIIPLRPAR